MSGFLSKTNIGAFCQGSKKGCQIRGLAVQTNSTAEYQWNRPQLNVSKNLMFIKGFLWGTSAVGTLPVGHVILKRYTKEF